MKRLVIIDSFVMFIENIPQESDEIFYDRINFIIKNYSEHKPLDKLIDLSLMYANIKYKKCSYQEFIFQN